MAFVGLIRRNLAADGPCCFIPANVIECYMWTIIVWTNQRNRKLLRNPWNYTRATKSIQMSDSKPIST